MDFIEAVNNVKQRICEANKKVSYSQRSPIQTKKALKDRKLGSLGLAFSISANEVIESALFDRITRDCKGELMRVNQIRRFRKVGSDEWFSMEASKANDIWDDDFESSSDEEAIEQGQSNTTKLQGGEDSSPQVTYAANFSKVNPVEQAKKAEKQRIRNLNNGVIGAAIIAAIFMGYQVVKAKRK
jgi:hypothetical protein